MRILAAFLLSLGVASACAAGVSFERASSLIETSSGITTLPNHYELDHAQALGPLPFRMVHSSGMTAPGASVETRQAVSTEWYGREFGVLVEQRGVLHAGASHEVREMNAISVSILHGRFTVTDDTLVQIALLNTRAASAEGGPRADFVFYRDDDGAAAVDWRSYDQGLLETTATLTPGVWNFQLWVESHARSFRPGVLDLEHDGAVDLSVAFVPGPTSVMGFALLGIFAARRRR